MLISPNNLRYRERCQQDGGYILDFPNVSHSALIDSLADDLVNSEVGVVSFIDEIKRSPGSPNFFHYRAQAANTLSFCNQRNFANSGGAAVTRTRARRKALGEAVERYSAAIYQPSEFPLYSYSERPVESVNPASFALYSSGQFQSSSFPWVPFTEKTLARWVPAIDLITGAITNVPACRVYLPYVFYKDDGEEPFDQPISTGLACHETFHLAALSAICEVIERDAFTITWQAMISPPRIDKSSCPSTVRAALEKFSGLGHAVDMFLINLDIGVPTVLSVLRAPRHLGSMAVFAASCSPKPEEAVLKSLEELAHTHHYCSIIKGLVDRSAIAARTNHDVVDQLTHLGFYLYEENHAHLDFLYRGSKEVAFPDIEDASRRTAFETLRSIISNLDRVNQRAYFANVTSPDIAQLGLNVVRAVVPGLHPLRMGHELRSLGGERLWSVPQKLGYVGIKDGNDNPAPHPYP
jgi:ribosomal protein S12 methylthiotransferase accessory factor